MLLIIAEKKKDMNQQEVEIKKKAKELKVLDPKSAQNLCMYLNEVHINSLRWYWTPLYCDILPIKLNNKIIMI